MYFPKAYSSFYDFSNAQAGCSRHLVPPEANPPCTTIPSLRINFNFGANMASNRPWLVVDAIAVLCARYPLPKHPQKLLWNIDLDNDVLPEDHIKQFMLSLRLMNVNHEAIMCILFLYTLVGKASTWFFSLAQRSITYWQQFQTAFIT